MASSVKAVDVFGLQNPALACQSSSKNDIDKNVVISTDDAGDIACIEVLGASGIKAASALYHLIDTLSLGGLALGDAGNGNLISQISLKTAAGQVEELTLTGFTGLTGVATIGAPSGKKASYAIPALSVLAGNYAQKLYSMATSGELQSCTLTLTCNVVWTLDDEGKHVHVTVNGGQAELTAEMETCSGASITFTEPSGWAVTSPPGAGTSNAEHLKASATAIIELVREGAGG